MGSMKRRILRLEESRDTVLTEERRRAGREAREAEAVARLDAIVARLDEEEPAELAWTPEEEEARVRELRERIQRIRRGA
jgi:hypothetical protein